MNETVRPLVERLFDAEGRKAWERMAAEDPEWAALVDTFALEKVWSRPGLSLRERSLVTLASQVALGRWDQVTLHMRSFLHQGGSREELREVCLQLAIYCGFPATLSALKALREIP